MASGMRRKGVRDVPEVAALHVNDSNDMSPLFVVRCSLFVARCSVKSVFDDVVRCLRNFGSGYCSGGRGEVLARYLQPCQRLNFELVARTAAPHSTSVVREGPGMHLVLTIWRIGSLTSRIRVKRTLRWMLLYKVMLNAPVKFT